MCGRFLLALEPAELQDEFPDFNFEKNINPRFNIAPTQPVLVIPNLEPLRMDYYIWGLIPRWAKDRSSGYKLINARAETIAEKPSFKSSYKYHRCIVFSNGFYEWTTQPDSKTKKPMLIKLKTGKPFAFAGLWDEWLSTDGSSIKSCTIITTQANTLVNKIHARMPVILSKPKLRDWLNPLPQNPDKLQNLLIPYPSEEMVAIPVSTLVNNPSTDNPDCISPISNN